MRLTGVLGQNRAVNQLSAELAAGRLSHAYVFTGPTGCGRGTAAMALFQALNCQHPEGDTPCGQCGPCHRVQSGNHEDLVVLAPPAGAASAQIKVEEVRQAIRTISFPPFGGGWRVVLIRQAENLNPTSANVLLKTLEEPPPNNILVLTVRDAKGILPTLLSRCRRVNFMPLDGKLIAEELVRRGVEPQAAALKAAMSGGSLGRALELDQDKLAGELERMKAAVSGHGDATADWKFAEELVGEFRGAYIDRQGLAEALDLLAIYFRDAALMAAGRGSGVLLPAGQVSPLDPERAAQAFSQVRQAQKEILANAAPELVLAVLLGRLRSA